MKQVINLIKNYSYLALIMNSVTIVFNILPYLGLNILKTISTILFIITVAIDLGLIYLTLSFINRNHSMGQKLKKICQFYLIFFFVAIILLMLDSIIYSFLEVGNFLRVVSFIGSQIAYYGIYTLGLLTAIIALENINNPEVWK